MRLVERHIVKPAHAFYKEFDDLAWRSKNLYNLANYLVRQSFFQDVYLDNCKIYPLVKEHKAYKALPAKVSNQVLIRLNQNWRGFFASTKQWQKTPEKFLGKPKIPGYKDKVKGRFCLTYEKGAISSKFLDAGLIKLSGTNIIFPTQKVRRDNLKQVRIIPRCGQYVIEVIYEVPDIEPITERPRRVAAIDLGLNNLAAITSNWRGFSPLLINGRPLKAINQYYNKQKAKLQSLLKGKASTSKRIKQLTAKRNNRIDDYLHKASRRIMQWISHLGIDTLIIGKNDGWKQDIGMGRQNNQSFVNVPHAQFIEMLQYKAELAGILVTLTEESYTSKASFLDLDPMPVYGSETSMPRFSGRRTKRGLYRSAQKTYINADINGSYNILRKVFPTVFDLGIGDVAVRPCGTLNPLTGVICTQNQ